MLVKEIIENNSCNFKKTPRHVRIEKLRKSLSGKLTKPDRLIVLQIADEYDLILDLCSRQNYKKGLIGGFELAKLLLSTNVKFPKE